MYSLTLFEVFLLTHLVMDWIFQWKWEAAKKSKEWLPLFFHCFVYTIGFIPVFLIYSINFLWLLLIFISHFIFDQRKLEVLIMERFKGFKKEGDLEAFWNIVLIGIDQTLHLVILALVVIFS